MIRTPLLWRTIVDEEKCVFFLFFFCRPSNVTNYMVYIRKIKRELFVYVIKGGDNQSSVLNAS